MSFTVLDCPQRSPEWHAARLGRLTGSRAAYMLATVQKGEAAGRRNLRTAMVLERITGRSQERVFASQAMEDGVEREPDAAALYEAATGRLLTATGFLQHDTLMAGVSLDGHVGDWEGIIEIKCPTPAIHLGYVRSGVVPDNYGKQILHSLWMTGAQWCDFTTYHPDFPEASRIKLVRVTRNEAAIAEYEKKAIAFLDEVQAEHDALLTMNNLHDQLESAVTGA